MSHVRTLVASLLAACLGTLTVACGDGTVNVGSSELELKKKKDGGSTGNGKTCSWEDAVSSDGSTSSAPNGEYKVGDTFPSSDGCNTCHCTVDGIACTAMYCEPKPRACTEEAKQCPDGSYVSRTGPNCDFAPCPGERLDCAGDAKQCPDGSHVGRTGPNCEFARCPGEPIACTTDAKQCPDGSYVGRTGPNCEFAPCP